MRDHGASLNATSKKKLERGKDKLSKTTDSNPEEQTAKGGRKV
jgi:hypothetical protein